MLNPHFAEFCIWISKNPRGVCVGKQEKLQGSRWSGKPFQSWTTSEEWWQGGLEAEETITQDIPISNGGEVEEGLWFNWDKPWQARHKCTKEVIKRVMVSSQEKQGKEA